MEDARPTKGNFLCSICGNESASGPSLKRHMRYCLKKSTLSRGRKKACQLCVQAKARCEASAWGCHRCTEKGLACSLVVPMSSQDGINMETMGDFSLETEAEVHLVMDQLPTQQDLSSSILNSSFPFDLFTPSTPLVSGSGSNSEASNDLNFKSSSPLHIFSHTRTLRLFEAKPFHTPSTIMASTMGIGILRSYPLMMRSRNTFPPFIHPCSYGSKINDWTLPKSLERAVSVAASLAGDATGTLSSIREEQQRIDNEMLDMGIEDLISSGQALIIYVLMRIESGPSELDEDVHLYSTLSKLCFRIPSLPRFYERMAEFSPWKQWVIVESKRRLNSTLRLMTQLYNLDVAPNPSLTIFTAMPLPASKLLWKASSEAEWEAEISRDDFYKNLSLKDLMRFKGVGDGDQPSREEWGRWYSGTDELGILVVISTSLL